MFVFKSDFDPIFCREDDPLKKTWWRYNNIFFSFPASMLSHLILNHYLAEKMILHKNDTPNLGENLRSNLVLAAKGSHKKIPLNL